MFASSAVQRTGILICAFACAHGNSHAEDIDLSTIEAEPQAVALEKFLELEAGLKKTEADKLLGTTGQHQFTYLAQDGHTYLLTSYDVQPQGSDFRYMYYVLFDDGLLTAILDAQDVTDHFKALRGGKPSPIPSEKLAFDDDKYMRETLKVRSFGGEDIVKSRERIRQHVLSKERHLQEVMQKSTPNPITGLLASQLLKSMNLEKEYEINAQHVEMFDPEKIKVGMTVEEVNQIFGIPPYAEDLDDSYRVGLYGPEKPRTVAVGVAVSPVLVLFRNGSVNRVVSHGYFNASWKEKIWPKPGGQ